MSILSAVFAFLWLLIIAALHLINRDFRPATHTVSEYVSGKHGWLLRLACFSMAVSQCLAALAQTQINSTSIFFAALCWLFAMMGIFKTDPVLLGENESRTISGNLHIGAAMISIVLLNAAAVITAVKTVNPLFVAIGAVLPFSTLAFFVAVIAAVRGKKAVFGVLQRANILIATLWQILFVTVGRVDL